MPAERVQKFVRFAWFTLAITVVVIVWGAVVRATGSGAGCGSHWPLCNGDVVPLAPTTSTIIEFTHRLTSGLALVLSVVMFVWARRLFPQGHRTRTWAGAALGFMLGEAAIGAGIVLLELVENNASALRAIYQGVHLTNTMFLVGAMTGAIRFSGSQVLGFSGSQVLGFSGSQVLGFPGSQVLGSSGPRPRVVVTMALMILVAAFGAIVALGDTLFPHASLAEGIAADFDSTSHFLIRLRIWHPILAAAAALLTVFTLRSPLVTTLIVAQAGLGVLNLMMLAPLPLQMAHLLGSNVLWIAMVWSAAGSTDNLH
jgi:heme A synthase